jgi:hypothetical protein
MLKAMRHNAKYFYVLFFIVILSFIFWGVGTVDKSDQRDVVAEVGPYKISAQDFWQTYERVFNRYRDIYKDKFDEAMQEKLKLKENVMNSLVEEKVLLTVAKRNGVTVSDAELNEAIKNEPAFMQNGVFDTRVYQNRLRLSRLTPEGYEAARKQELIADKMRRLIELSVNLPADLPDTGSSDEKTAKALRDAMVLNARMNAVKAYVKGVEKGMKIKIYEDRIS